MTDNSEAVPQVTDRGAKPCKLNYCCPRCFSNEMSSFFFLPGALWKRYCHDYKEENWRLLLLLYCPLLVPKHPEKHIKSHPQGKYLVPSTSCVRLFFFSRNYHLNKFLSYYSFKLIGCAILARQELNTYEIGSEFIFELYNLERI